MNQQEFPVWEDLARLKALVKFIADLNTMKHLLLDRLIQNGATQEDIDKVMYE